MSEPNPRNGASIHSSVRVGGDLTGQVATGLEIQQQSTVGAPVSAADRAALDEAIGAIKDLIRRSGEQLPDEETRDEALRKTDELAAAVTADEPRLSTIEYVRDWLTEHVRPAGEAVSRLVLSPLLAKFVATGGDVLVAEFRRRFGIL